MILGFPGNSRGGSSKCQIYFDSFFRQNSKHCRKQFTFCREHNPMEVIFEIILWLYHIFLLSLSGISSSCVQVLSFEWTNIWRSMWTIFLDIRKNQSNVMNLDKFELFSRNLLFFFTESNCLVILIRMRKRKMIKIIFSNAI